MENPIKMDDLGGTIIFGHTHLVNTGTYDHQILTGAPKRKGTRYPLVNDHIAGWNIPSLTRKYIVNPGRFSSQLCYLDYRSVPQMSDVFSWFFSVTFLADVSTQKSCSSLFDKVPSCQKKRSSNGGVIYLTRLIGGDPVTSDISSTLPETNIFAPENRPGPKRKQSYSNHPFSGATVDGCTTWDVWNPKNNGINYQPQLLLTDFSHQQYVSFKEGIYLYWWWTWILGTLKRCFKTRTLPFAI